MERTDVENIINQNIKDNVVRDISPTKTRTALGAILDFIVGNSGGAWGEITGTLSDQTDLQDALDLIAASIPPAAEGNDVFNYYNFSQF